MSDSGPKPPSRGGGRVKCTRRRTVRVKFLGIGRGSPAEALKARRRVRSHRMSLQTTATITPARRIGGTLRVPGDKSISHRYALLAALAAGSSRLTGYAPGADCRSTLACLQRLGVEIVEDTEGVLVLGRGLGHLRSPSEPLDAGNSGTTMRLLA